MPMGLANCTPINPPATTPNTNTIMEINNIKSLSLLVSFTTSFS